MNKRQKLFSVTIKDCQLDTFAVGGHGGAGKDTSNTGVRIVHPPSGAVGRAVEHRSQLQNKQLAFRRMGESKEFRTWARLKAAELSTHKSVEQLIDEQMQPQNLKIEIRTAEGWKEE